MIMPLPNGFDDTVGVSLHGENLLLRSDDQGKFRYGCCAYVTDTRSGQTLPVISCRAWFHAPLPAPSGCHPIWAEIGIGLVEAVLRLNSSRFDLNGAVTAARSWVAHRQPQMPSHNGSAVLTSRDEHVLCGVLPGGPPTTAAIPSIKLVIPKVRNSSLLRLAA